MPTAGYDTPVTNPVKYKATIVISLGGSSYLTLHTDEVECTNPTTADARLLALVEAAAGIAGGTVQVEVKKTESTTATSYV